MCTFHNYLILLWYFALNTHYWSLFFNRTPFRVNSFIFSLTPIRSLFVLWTLYPSIHRSQSLSPSLLLPLYSLLKGFPLYVFPLLSSFPIYHFFHNSILTSCNLTLPTLLFYLSLYFCPLSFAPLFLSLAIDLSRSVSANPTFSRSLPHNL